MKLDVQKNSNDSNRWRRLELTVAIGAILSTPAWVAAAETGTKQKNSSIEEVIVTAQFVSQNVQDTPLAMTAVTNEMMEARSQTTIEDVAKQAPSVNMTQSASGGGPAAVLTIRGVGQTDFFPAVEPGVGSYVDDVYYGVMLGSVFELLDVERAEVLRGPQGTLSGKNSEGGSLKLYSRLPANEKSGYAEFEYGSNNRQQVRAGANIPLIDGKLFLRMSGLSRDVEGYVKRIDYGCATGGPSSSALPQDGCKLGDEGGQKISALRGALRWIITDDIENNLILDRTKDTSEPAATKLRAQDAGWPGPPGTGWAGSNNYVTGKHSYTNYANYVGHAGTPEQFHARTQNTTDQWGVSNTLDVGFSDVLSLKSITAYRETNSDFAQDGDASPADIFIQQYQLEHRQFTQELRLSGQVDELLEWTVGAYYYRAKQDFGNRIDANGGFVPGGGGLGLDFVSDDSIDADSKSVFANTVFYLSDSLSLNMGLRYTDESKEYTYGRMSPTGGPAHPAVAPLDGVVGDYSGDEVDYRVAIDYRWSDSLMTYAQVATGFKGGGVNARPYFESQAVPFDPETVTSYEIGFKSDLFDRRLRFNMAAYLTDFTDMQLIVTSCDAISPFPGAPCTQTTNAGDSELQGVEMELLAKPIDNLTVDMSASYTDFEYTKVNPLTNIPKSSDQPFLPSKKASIGAQYEFGLAFGTITPRIDYVYQSEFETEVTATPYGKVNGYGLANARVTYRSPEETWEAAVAVTNLTDKFYYANVFDRSGVPYYTALGNPGRPREWRASLKYKF